jgi:hypothetical protein
MTTSRHSLFAGSRVILDFNAKVGDAKVGIPHFNSRILSEANPVFYFPEEFH